ncbi:MAG: hypothetical protein KQI35_08830 [Bacteroidetes bacterium]|nr:hypothetical protein [Bacteroidota bacterium]
MKDFTFILLLFMVFTASGWLNAQPVEKNYDGTYTLDDDGVTLSLVLKQAEDRQVTGTLSSTTGIHYQLEGEYLGEAVSGICSDQHGAVFFEMYFFEGELILSLIEPDQNNMPDYNTATYLNFTRSAVNETQDPAADIGADQSNAEPENSNSHMNANANNQQDLTGNEIGDPAWGFVFMPPAGWIHQQDGSGMILGHNTIAGLILVLPHMLQNLQEVQQEMLKGIQEEGQYLQLSGTIANAGNNMLAADYQGIMDGQQVKAKGFGTLSPYGGGAFIIAITTPDQLGEDIIRDAKAIATNLRYSKPNTSELMQHFAAKWANFTTNTSTWIQFNPDGTYDEQYESSYSGDLSGGGNWGAYGDQQSKGRWTVQGNRDAGRIIVRMSDGNEIIYDYRVHEERGEKYYSEYWFNGKLYAKSRE